MKARVIALHHVQLAMPPNGEERAVRFYQDLLGIPQLVKPAGLDAAGCWFEEGDLRIHLGVEKTFIESIEYDEDEQVLLADVGREVAASPGCGRWCTGLGDVPPHPSGAAARGRA